MQEKLNNDTRDTSLEKTRRVPTTFTPESTYDGMQLTLENFQFDLENKLQMSQLTWRSTE